MKEGGGGRYAAARTAFLGEIDTVSWKKSFNGNTLEDDDEIYISNERGTSTDHDVNLMIELSMDR